MPLSWAQIKIRASNFSKEWQDAKYEKGESQSFYNDFFEVFGVKRRSVARYEEHVRKLDNSSGFIDLFWPGVLLVEHKSAGRDLTEAAEQAGRYFDALPEEEKPRYQLVCDFQTFGLLDRDGDVSVEFTLADLHEYVENFAFIIGKQRPNYGLKERVNIRASISISDIHKGLTSSGYPEGDLEKFLTRLVFCLFADGTGIFQPRGCFLDLLESRTRPDGSDLGTWLSHLFQVLNTPEDRRQRKLDPDLSQFPYINGSLFAEVIAIPSVDAEMRRKLLKAGEFDWSDISPAVFGSLFQSVLSKAQRRELGGYATSEADIHKVVDELFLFPLHDELARIPQAKFKRVIALKQFQEKLGELTFLDPACGCGNFLVIAYRELRKLELRVLTELRDLGEIDPEMPHPSIVDVDQFFAIEKREYSARIAETAMWMTDHIANNELSLALGIEYHRVPLKKAPTIVINDALKEDWKSLMPANAKAFILGNPPYAGSKMQSPEVREQIRAIAQLGGSGGTLDYVCGWILKAAEYASAGTRIGLVTVNSVIQGEQAGQLWPILFDRFSLELSFAHQAFAWHSESPGASHVQVVILGLDHRSYSPKDKRLYQYADAESAPQLVTCQKISPYLVAGDNLRNSHTVVRETPRTMNGLKKLRTGTKPIDGGYYILTESERTELLREEPGAAKFIRPFIGGVEFLKGEKRYILVLEDAPPKELRSLPKVMKLIEKVREYRRGRIANKEGKRFLDKPNPIWETPTKFHITSLPPKPFLVVPEVTSERRKYVPIAWLEPPCVPSNLVKCLYDATLVDFALLTSAMHMAWLARIGGRLEGRYRYSIQLVYNTFPVPNTGDLGGLEPFAKAVLSARRDAFPQASLEDLYDPRTMPTGLVQAHKKLDMEVDRVYLGRPAKHDQDRLENLLQRYEIMTKSG